MLSWALVVAELQSCLDDSHAELAQLRQAASAPHPDPPGLEELRSENGRLRESLQDAGNEEMQLQAKIDGLKAQVQYWKTRLLKQ